MLIVSIIYNIIALLIFKNTIAIAGATILTLLTWVIYSGIDLKNIKNDYKMFIYLIVMTVSFISISHLFNWIIGGLLYLLIYIIITYWYNKEIYIEVWKMIKKFFVKFKSVLKRK